MSILFFVVVTFQSCAAGVVNAIEDKGGTSGSIGIMVAILPLAGGIISIATRKSYGKGGNIALIVIFGLAAVFGIIAHGNYSDLIIWGIWALINMALAIVALVKS